MGSPVQLYLEQLHQRLGYFATWLPNDLIAIGDIGVLEGGRFRKVASLDELGIKCGVSEAGQPATFNYSSTNYTHVEAGGGAEVAELARAEIKFTFTRRGAYALQATNARNLQMANRVVVAEAILDRLLSQKWELQWLVIEALYEADAATVIVSQEDKGELVLSAEMELPVGTLPLADPKLGLRVESTSGTVLALLAEQGLKPAYACMRVQRSWTGSTSVRPVRGTGGQSAINSFERPALAELLDS
jgi:hypothetical protein